MKHVADVLSVLWLSACVLLWFFAFAFSGDAPGTTIQTALVSSSLFTLVIASPAAVWLLYGAYKAPSHGLTKKGMIFIAIALVLIALLFLKFNVFAPFMQSSDGPQNFKISTHLHP